MPRHGSGQEIPFSEARDLKRQDGGLFRVSPIQVLQWLKREKPVEAAYSWENKTAARCRQCGRTFVRYVYEKVVRCEKCRKAARMAALSTTDERGLHGSAGSRGPVA